MVADVVPSNRPLQSLKIKLVFPTAESPASMTLKTDAVVTSLHVFELLRLESDRRMLSVKLSPQKDLRRCGRDCRRLSVDPSDGSGPT